MKLSHSIHKGVLESAVGSLINKFHFKPRRDTLFFDDITIRYLQECDKKNFDEIRELVKKWMFVLFDSLLPPMLKGLPPVFFFNQFIKKIWLNLGYMEDLYLEKKGEKLFVTTKNERYLKTIGINSFTVGGFQGALALIFNHDADYIGVKKRGNNCTYEFRLKQARLVIPHKSMDNYLKSNEFQMPEGFTLKDALKFGIFKLEANKLYLRGTGISALENTYFHLLSQKKILFDKLAVFSYEYFKEVVDKKTSESEKIKFLKTLLQTMGWGVVIVFYKSKKDITVQIKHPPHGIQKEDDNWSFLNVTILGYLWLLNRKLKISSVKFKNETLEVSYRE